MSLVLLCYRRTNDDKRRFSKCCEDKDCSTIISSKAIGNRTIRTRSKSFGGDFLLFRGRTTWKKGEILFSKITFMGSKHSFFTLWKTKIQVRLKDNPTKRLCVVCGGERLDDRDTRDLFCFLTKKQRPALCASMFVCVRVAFY